MIINPRHALEQQWIKLPEWLDSNNIEKYIQPNAIDFTVDHLFQISDDISIITETERKFRSYSKIDPDIENFWYLQPNTVYDALSDFYVEVPQGVACLLVNRSSFSRNGIHINAGLYDSSFKGNIGYTITNRSGILKTSPNTRIGQIVFIESDSCKSYDGIYNNVDVGKHWSK